MPSYGSMGGLEKVLRLNHASQNRGCVQHPLWSKAAKKCVAASPTDEQHDDHLEEGDTIELHSCHGCSTGMDGISTQFM